jgi:hypothetical protein
MLGRGQLIYFYSGMQRREYGVMVASYNKNSLRDIEIGSTFTEI